MDTIPINRLSQNLVLILALFTILLPLTFGKRIEGSFEYCTIDKNSPRFSMSRNCARSLEEVQSMGYKNYFVLGMSKYSVDGYGYKCTRKENQMVCDGDRCSFEGEPYFEYRWLEERVYVSYQCSTMKIQIRGYSLNDKLFERANNQCTAKDNQLKERHQCRTRSNSFGCRL
ncbi:hypothetical protein BpHYR1_018706 [Brachionus plicatilis]|uniref:Uncharacterized protein n=1 Tax=Brachionus plicatilis TaxID=10195 RepID=A0A3M7QZ45_BRAPC|nr:hypothetical protein BpHYR1_018706 [Brachionus plicatilis]